MRRDMKSLLCATLLLGLVAPAGAQQAEPPKWALAIHGGAGVAPRDEMTPERRAAIEAVLHQALAAGEAVLRGGGDSVTAVEAAVRVMEDSPLFNAGRGAALDETGMARHDAAIMRGRDHAAGAVAGSIRIRNPISAARALMEEDGPVLLGGEGADRYAADKGLPLAPELYFQTEERRRALIEQRNRDTGATEEARLDDEARFGTVGAVAMDDRGDLAAATSTGGRTNKRLGRIGDSPLIGAGTYASNESCAVSATGHGEYFIRWTVARDVCALVEYRGMDIEAASKQIVIGKLKPLGGGGAVIALDSQARPAFAMNGRGMYRGFVSSAAPAGVAIYIDEALD